MKQTMDANERMLKLLQATPEMLAGIDEILAGGKPQETTGPLLMSMSQGCEYLGVSRTTLWRLIKRGKIEAVEFMPGSHKVRRRDLERIAGVAK